MGPVERVGMVAQGQQGVVQVVFGFPFFAPAMGMSRVRIATLSASDRVMPSAPAAVARSEARPWVKNFQSTFAPRV